MELHDDMSYINRNFVDKGLMRVVPYQIRLNRYFTEEEQAASRAYAESHNSEEWSAYCDRAREKIAAENLALMEFLEKHFTFGQFRTPYNDNYTFWFWCNDLYNTTNGRLSGRDYSYITLSLKKEDDKNEHIFARVKELLTNYPTKNIQAIFQYSQVENTDYVRKEAERIFKECEGKFVNYKGFIGKLKQYDGGYFFKKKYAKAYGYRISPMEICTSIST